jgi:hypothetical protein
MTKEQRSRLEMMADPSSETWDLSDNDIAAIKAALAALAAREAEVAGLLNPSTESLRQIEQALTDAANLCQSEAGRMKWSPKTAEHWEAVSVVLRSNALRAFVLRDTALAPPQPAPDTEACR